MEVDALRSHFIEKNVTRIKNANETSGRRAKHINRRFESNSQLSQDPEHAGSFVSGSCFCFADQKARGLWEPD